MSRSFRNTVMNATIAPVINMYQFYSNNLARSNKIRKCRFAPGQLSNPDKADS